MAAATGRNVLHAFQLDGRVLHVADLQVEKLAGRKLCDVEHEFDLSVILHKSPGRKDYNPRHERPLEKGDTVVVMAEQDRVRRLEEANRG